MDRNLFNIDSLLQRGDYSTLAELRRRFLKRKQAMTRFNKESKKKASQRERQYMRRRRRGEESNESETAQKKHFMDDDEYDDAEEELWNDTLRRMPPPPPYKLVETDSSVDEGSSVYDCMQPDQSSGEEVDSHEKSPVDKSGKMKDQNSDRIDDDENDDDENDDDENDDDDDDENPSEDESHAADDDDNQARTYECLTPDQSSGDDLDSHQIQVDKCIEKQADQPIHGMDEINEEYDLHGEQEKGYDISMDDTKNNISQNDLACPVNIENSSVQLLRSNHKTIDKSQGLRVATPGDGSCFFYALSRQIELSQRNTHVHVLDLPTLIGEKRNEYAKRNETLSPSQKKTSAFLRKWINEFIYHDADILLNLFDDACMFTDMQLPRLRANAKRAVSSNDWAGNEHIYALSVLTMTPFYMWTESTENDCYIRALNTTHLLERLRVLTANDPALNKRVVDICSRYTIHNDNNATINIFYRPGHYMTFVNFEK